MEERGVRGEGLHGGCQVNASRLRADRTVRAFNPGLSVIGKEERDRERERKREVRGLLVTRQIMAAISFLSVCCGATQGKSLSHRHYSV